MYYIIVVKNKEKWQIISNSNKRWKESKNGNNKNN